jgi:NAD(P)H-dependent flavin oxidoreductase YrpB (nitropropane dioxygenase family)
MLAGVDAVLMGAGIPRTIPGILDGLARDEAVQLKIDIEGAEPDDPASVMHFDPQLLFPEARPALSRPQFLAIVSSATLAMTLAKKSSGRVDGFIVEGALAGGHNAPPRGPLQLSATGEPIYGPRDLPDLPKIRELGLPFWLAGAFSRPGKLGEARAQGAAGVQVGTAFAFCEESGMIPDLKRRFRELIGAGEARVHTDPYASPTGFPFKIAQLAQTLSDAAAYAKRQRICDLGYLRQLFRRPDGSVGYRCAAEPVEDFTRKGGAAADTAGRKCLCNGLAATVGLGQARADSGTELPIVTAGDELLQLARYFDFSRGSYSAADVIRLLLDGGEPLPSAR